MLERLLQLSLLVHRRNNTYHGRLQLPRQHLFLLATCTLLHLLHDTNSLAMAPIPQTRYTMIQSLTVTTMLLPQDTKKPSQHKHPMRKHLDQGLQTYRGNQQMEKPRLLRRFGSPYLTRLDNRLQGWDNSCVG